MELFSIKIRCTFQLVSTDFTLKIGLKWGFSSTFYLISVSLRLGFVSPVNDSSFRPFATAWVVYEFVSHFRFALVEVLLFSAFLRAASQSAFR